MGRLEHLKETLPQNIKDNESSPDCQFVVLNYGGDPKTEDWVLSNFQSEIESGKVKYVSHPDAEHFYFSHAKNMAHRIADGGILCNLDADQYTGKDFARWLEKQFAATDQNKRPIFVRHSPVEIASNKSHSDSLGKIAMRREDFNRLRGYNERFTGWGGEDRDLMARMIKNRMKHISIPLSFAHSIPHSNELRVACQPEETRADSLRKIESRNNETPGIHSLTGKAMRFGGDLVRSTIHKTNPDSFGAGTVYVNGSTTPYIIPPIPHSLIDRSQGSTQAARALS